MSTLKPNRVFLNELTILASFLENTNQARIILKKYSLKEILNTNHLILNTINGLNQTTIKKISLLQQIITLNKEPYIPGPLFNQASNIASAYNYLIDEEQEQFLVLYLDQSKHLITSKTLFIGTVNASLVSPREIFKTAYLLSASFIICLHNHPGGTIIPSSADIATTKRINELGIIHGIILLDHIIIGHGYYSFFENHQL